MTASEQERKKPCTTSNVICIAGVYDTVQSLTHTHHSAREESFRHMAQAEKSWPWPGLLGSFFDECAASHRDGACTPSRLLCNETAIVDRPPAWGAFRYIPNLGLEWVSPGCTM